jgi:hypothetical protein
MNVWFNKCVGERVEANDERGLDEIGVSTDQKDQPALRWTKLYESGKMPLVSTEGSWLILLPWAV